MCNRFCWIFVTWNNDLSRLKIVLLLLKLIKLRENSCEGVQINNFQIYINIGSKAWELSFHK